jgi:hypothetical protein
MRTVITIKGIVPGLNGKHGLIREHFRNAKKRKNLYTILCREQNPNKHPGKVIIHYIGYKSVLMDWDNFSASFKHIGDAPASRGNYRGCGINLQININIFANNLQRMKK